MNTGLTDIKAALKAIEKLIENKQVANVYLSESYLRDIWIDLDNARRTIIADGE